jgi:hypothetical protein
LDSSPRVFRQASVGRERHWWFIIRAGQPENDTSDVVLRVRRKIARGFECQSQG